AHPCGVATLSNPTGASLFSLPKRTKRAVLAVWKIKAFFARTAHVALAYRHGLDAVLKEKVLHFLLDLRVRCYVRDARAVDDGLGPVRTNHASSDLGRRLVVGAVRGDSADGILRWLRALAVLHLVLLDRRLPLVQVRFGEKVLVVLGDKPSCFL